MSRVGWLLLVLAVVAGGAVAAVPRLPADAVVRAAADFVPADDPFPIRRVRGADARLTDLLKELEPGPVVRLPRGEFEARVRAAGRAVMSAKGAARVVDATYTAELDGGDLTGTAELGILNPHGVTGFVPLDPLKLAVRGVKWSDGPAVLAVPQGATSPAVWVDRAGRRVLQLNWSLAGTTEPGERRFELRVPPCPASSLELSLPADQVPTASADVLLTGPFEAPGQPARRLWRLRFGGRSKYDKVEFAVRSAGASGVVAQAKLAARYDLAAGQLTAAFEYELHPARGSAVEWAFTADPGLRITDVVANNRAGWTVDPPAKPGGPRQVRVSLRQPGPGGKVLVTAVAPFPDPAKPDAPLPAIRPLNAVLDDEKLELRIAPGLKVESWSAGDYRLADATTAATAPPPGAADQSRVLSLVGTLLPAGAAEEFRRLPAVRTAPVDAEFTTHERLAWELDASRTVLVARVSVRVRRGPLFQVAVKPPPGFTLDRSASGSDELVSHLGPLVGGQHAVEFARPLATGQQAEFRLEFHGSGVKPGEPAAFPAFAVNGAAERDGWLSVSAAPAWALSVRPGAGASRGGLWGWLTTDAPAEARALYLFRGREPDGTAAINPARQSVTVGAVVRLDAAAGRWVASTRLTITSNGSGPLTVAVFVPGPPGERSWKLLDDANSVTEATAVPRELLEALPLFAPLDARAGVVAAHACAGLDGTLWVLRFARPLAGAAVIETTAPGAAVNDAAAALPVPRVVGEKQTTRAEPAPAVADRTEVVLEGDFVRPRARPARAGGPMPASDAYLVTVVRAPGEALAAFGGTVRDSRGGVLRLFLPEGAEIRGVCVAGRWLNPAACSARDSDGALPVPIPAGAAVRFEVRYRLPVSSGWPTQRIASAVPQAAHGEAFPPVKRWWAFAAGTLPGWPARPWDATAEEPPLLGGPLGGERLAVVTQSDDEWVRAGAARTADAFAVAVAASLAVLGLVALRRRRARGAVILAAIVVVNLLTVELGPPWWARAAWPPLVAATLALGVVLAGLAARGRSSAPAAVATAALLFLVHSLVATAQPAAPVTVLIIPTANGEEVVASRATLDRLDALAQPPPSAAVVTSAEYDVRTDDAGAHVTAKFVVHAFRSGENAVSLPLSDARLERATVDGAAAFPTSPQPGTYALTVAGPGRHEVELRFAASITAAGPEREVRFGVPEVPEAKLIALLPGPARQPQTVGRVGRQVVTTGADRTAVAADLGAAKSVHLRWREGAAGAAVVKVREACIWELSEAGGDLTAAYLVRVEQGTIAGMRFEIPSELEVLRVAARTIDAPVGAIPLRDWSLAPEKAGGRLLRVDFQAPAAGRLVVVLECSPRQPLTRQPVLRFPRVNFGGVTGQVESVYGLRPLKLTIDGVGLVGVIDFSADALKDFAAVPDLKLDPANPVRAFQPAPGAAGELRPLLHVGEPPVVRTATAWHAGPHRADATGTVSWQAKEALPLIEFAVGATKMLEVRGADVTGWSQSGGRVQVWLRSGAREGMVEWTGTLTLAPPSKTPESYPFDPPHPVVAHAKHAGDDLRVKAADGWTLRPDRTRGWQSLPAPPGELRFHTDLPAAPGLRVQLAQLPTPRAGR